MPKNLFVTGDINTGKTTIIRRLIDKYDLNPGGFMTGRAGKDYDWSAFWLKPVVAANRQQLTGRIGTVKKGVFARRRPDGSWSVHTRVFNRYGVALLEGCPQKDIIIMDELGRFEGEAYAFQDKVLEKMQSRIPVLGVIKQESNPFLDRVRQELTEAPLQLTVDNREQLFREAAERLKHLLEED